MNSQTFYFNIKFLKLKQEPCQGKVLTLLFFFFFFKEDKWMVIQGIKIWTLQSYINFFRYIIWLMLQPSNFVSHQHKKLSLIVTKKWSTSLNQSQVAWSSRICICTGESEKLGSQATQPHVRWRVSHFDHVQLSH